MLVIFDKIVEWTPEVKTIWKLVMQLNYLHLCAYWLQKLPK